MLQIAKRGAFLPVSTVPFICPVRVKYFVSQDICFGDILFNWHRLFLVCGYLTQLLTPPRVRVDLGRYFLSLTKPTGFIYQAINTGTLKRYHSFLLAVIISETTPLNFLQSQIE